MGPDGGALRDDSGPVLGSDDARAPGGTVHCSSDLHSLLDEDNREVSRCPAGLGCFDGRCIAACDAAAGNKSTEVTISPTVAIAGGRGVKATAKGAPITYTLGAGEYIKLATRIQPAPA